MAKGNEHPVFQSAHNPGQVTTRHRVVQAGRDRASKEGPHPEKGQFAYTTPVYDPDKPDSINMNPPRVYESPSGSKVTIVYPDKAPPSPYEQTVTVNGESMIRAAAQVYVSARFGLDV